MSGGRWADAAKKVLPLVIAIAAAAIEHGTRNSKCRDGEPRVGKKPSRDAARKRSGRKTRRKKS
jgi:hypothetical protein